ncbi:hypothetical protein V6N12_010485 [Hibiscus sabdariffa]|uniref:DUF7745 domain-containing protein n=1 Tax=Hibiscus sabdariffa TaxID=183260 RepID=A0ABR2EK72_9ROSI
MGDVFRSTDEKNSDVQIWLEGEQQFYGDSTPAGFVSEMMIQTFVGATHNDVSGLKAIWDSWGREMKDTFKADYGDIAYLLSVPVDEPLIQALARFWNPTYTCFTFGNIDLTPTIEEYSALIHCPKIDENRMYSKPR